MAHDAQAIWCYFVIDAGSAATEQQWQSLINAVKPYPLVAALIAAKHGIHTELQAWRRSVAPAGRYTWCRLIISGTATGRDLALPDRQALKDIYIISGGDPADVSLDTSVLDVLSLILQGQAGMRGIGGGSRAMFAGVLQAELRAAATDLGYGAAAVSNIQVEIKGLGSAYQAIAEANAAMSINLNRWEEMTP
jgi:hypothetical protein